MKILKKGHRYQLKNLGQGNELTGQIIQFIEKKPVTEETHPELFKFGVPEEGTLYTLNDGTTNEEVLEMMIDRLQTLQDKHSCKENEQAIIKIEEALMWLNKRTAERKKRNVEGRMVD